MRKLQWVGLIGVMLTSLPLLSGCLTFERGEFLGVLPMAAVPTFGSIAAEASFGHFAWPVTPALSDDVERLIDRIEREGVPVLDPIENQNAPIFCMDPPTDKEVYEALPPVIHGVPFIFEVQRNNVRITVEKLVDTVDECRVFPLVGPAQIHHCHFKCTVWYDETYWMAWPIPWSYTDHKVEVIYIDKDHLHRCGHPGRTTLAGR
jgi:hypothetical protein